MADRSEKEKKRKREKDGSSRLSKRVAIERDKQIKISLLKSDEWAPVIGMLKAKTPITNILLCKDWHLLASTPGLTVPSSISLEPFVKQRRNTHLQRLGKGSEIAATELLLHSSEHPKLDYTAREEESGGSNTLLKHYIGVYDPESGKMEVMEARKVIVRGVVRAHQATTEDEAAVVSAQNNPNYRFVTDALYRNSETAGTTLDRHSVRRKQRRPLHQSQRTPSIRASSPETLPRHLNRRNLPLRISLCSVALQRVLQMHQQKRSKRKRWTMPNHDRKALKEKGTLSKFILWRM
jgi:hypothetical protein